MDLILSPAEWRTIATVAFAMVLGGVIGFEREVRARPAGFRTHMLVAGAAAFLVGSANLLVDQVTADSVAAPMVSQRIMSVDPLRMVEAVVAGVSFIGAGCIFASREADTVQGITTAASLLMVAAIGLCAGLGHLLLAAAVTLLTLVVLALLQRIERRMRRDPD